MLTNKLAPAGREHCLPVAAKERGLTQSFSRAFASGL